MENVQNIPIIEDKNILLIIRILISLELHYPNYYIAYEIKQEDSAEKHIFNFEPRFSKTVDNTMPRTNVISTITQNGQHNRPKNVVFRPIII